MLDIADYVSPRDLQKIANLQVLARFVVEGFCAGLHRSPHKGFSVEFKQHRSYVPGDDIRYLDWKVFGKSDRFFVREYEAETNLRSTLLVDMSGSMAYGGAGSDGAPARGIPKFDYAVRLAVCLAYVMLQQQDSVGLVTFDTKILRYVPPRSRPKHLESLITELVSRKPGGETDLASVFSLMIPKIHRRGLLVILSDCFGDVSDLLRALAQFRHNGHEVVVFQILDRDELEFPFTQWTRFECLEKLGLAHTVDPAHLRAAYLGRLREYRDALTRGCRRHRIDLVPMVTDQPYAEALAHYLALRKRRP
jgi:uncharacterized protein (DUF58 family)